MKGCRPTTRGGWRSLCNSYFVRKTDSLNLDFIQVVWHNLSMKKVSLLAAGIIIVSLVLYFIPTSVKGSVVSPWDLATRNNPIMAYIGVLDAILLLILFLVRTKASYLVASFLYYLTIIPLFGSLDPNVATPRTFGIALILYSAGFILFILYGASVNSKLIQSPGIQFITRVNKLTFEYVALYIPMLSFCIFLSILSIYLLLNASSTQKDTLMYTGLLAFSILCMACSLLSLIPSRSEKKKRK